MKLTLEPVSTGETEIIVRGDISSEEVIALINYINAGNSKGK